MAYVSVSSEQGGFSLYARGIFYPRGPLTHGLCLTLDEKRASTYQVDLPEALSFVFSEAQITVDLLASLLALTERFACGSHEDCLADRRLARACWEEGRDPARLPEILEAMVQPILAELRRRRQPTFEDWYIYDVHDPRGVLRETPAERDEHLRRAAAAAPTTR